MKLYNALTQNVETFVPHKEPVTIYVCGITPYDTTHLGHAFTYTAFDVLIRYLEFSGFPVRYVQNVTDIDDDILRKAREVGEDWRALGDRWTAHFIQDMQALNVRAPDHYPRATEVIPGIVEAVQTLLKKNVAYESAGNVYFDIAAWPAYGQLSHLPAKDMLPVANEHGNRPDDPHKRHPLDFVLWQAQAPGEPAWSSPWGMGRPGWHIECSTMSTSLLGPTLDLHGGGADLIFPHHESEIAQAEGVTGQHPFVRFWLHTAMVGHDGEKMSKSLGNLVMIRDLLKDWSADALRLYLAQHHYRSAWSHDLAELAGAERLARRLHEAVTSASASGPALDVSMIQASFSEAMANDLDTPAAIGQLEQLAGEIIAAGQAGQNVQIAQTILRALSQVFGLRLDSPATEARVSAGWNEHFKRFI
ncbi:MAG: cysteine--tRNA ligase [Chloroflexota bacterium]|nr:MAG: cysteine--tRNA ligase [Chloroflexota bacterium]